MTDMTKAERLELAKIIRQRAKLAQADIDTRKAVVLADAEAALSRRFREDDEAWADITAEARQYMAEVKAKLQAKCAERGIPAEFRPSTGMYWLDRGENAIRERRAELRMTIRTRAEAQSREAKLEIQRKAPTCKSKSSPADSSRPRPGRSSSRCRQQRRSCRRCSYPSSAHRRTSREPTVAAAPVPPLTLRRQTPMTADDEDREFVRRLFATEAPPADVVPPTPLTPEERRAHLLALSANAGWAEVTLPGQVITDADGVPIGVEPSRTETVHRGAAVTPGELERAGLTPEDVPNLAIIDDIPRRTT